MDNNNKVNNRFVLSIAPHIHAGANTNRMMFMVVVALTPAIVMSVLLFHRSAVVYAATIISALLFEAVCSKIMGKEHTLGDFSAFVTSILLAMNLPATAPVWMCIVGSFVAIVIAKMVFGGLGCNPFNPALVARIFLLISFPVQMTTYIAPSMGGVDAVSAATVMSAAKVYSQAHGGLDGYVLPSAYQSFLGFQAGALGETSAIALLIGGLFLLLARVITWHIPVSFLCTAALLVCTHHWAHPDAILPPLVQLFSGGLILGAFFMATDYVTSPLYPAGKLIFGAGCGVITIMIRIFGNYPEGVAFSILVMNAATPLLDRYLRPRAYGEASIFERDVSK
ncbi:Na+-translocating ferredoxin:NAD+ oxidoreductase RNF, RnfD subunit [Deferribacterales bacterium RsTz2092]|nr:electron transport complex subunit D [Deferribacterales bacterium]